MGIKPKTEDHGKKNIKRSPEAIKLGPPVTCSWRTTKMNTTGKERAFVHLSQS